MSLYGLIIGLSVSLGIYLFEKNNTLVPKKLINIFIIGLLISLLTGARLYHVIDQWSYYSQNFLQIFNTRGGGLGIYGALIAGFIFIFLFSKIYKINFLLITNNLALVLPLCQSIGRFGNFVNGEISIWWLESLLCFVLFLFLHYFPRLATAKYLIGYGLIRLITEYFRHDTWVIGDFKIANFISIFFIFIGTILLHSKTTLQHHTL
ncbi:MAG: Prolipoprotein diacylglyceryl transferase [Microgenomates group bacterium GW2011_GWA2_40_6]|nr:MAG: Prolipoprotein diacylglyceryl transferase [Microgenomates group bacterium GW2011_GWA2_40_6]